MHPIRFDLGKARVAAMHPRMKAQRDGVKRTGRFFSGLYAAYGFAFGWGLCEGFVTFAWSKQIATASQVGQKFMLSISFLNQIRAAELAHIAAHLPPGSSTPGCVIPVLPTPAWRFWTMLSAFPDALQSTASLGARLLPPGRGWAATVARLACGAGSGDPPSRCPLPQATAQGTRHMAGALGPVARQRMPSLPPQGRVKGQRVCAA